MEVYSRSSWFLLLLGVAFVAATLHDSPDCPDIEKVSCVNGIKCNVNEDCQNSEICCQSPCYTKRCIPDPKGAAETDGPSESDCRPYIEKALKELEIGEVQLSEDNDQSIEDVPTVEITDDSSRQEDIGDQGDESEEAETENEPNAQSVEEEDIQQAIPEEATKSSEESVEAEGQAEADSSPEVTEPEESTKSEEEVEAAESAETSEEAEEPIEETDSELPIEAVASEAIQEAVEKIAEAVEESQENLDVNVVHVSPEEDEEEAKSTEDDESEEKQKSIEDEAQEAAEKAKSDEDKESAEAQQESVEDVKESAEQVVELVPESVEEEEVQSDDEKAEHVGCPEPDQVSCTEGTLCSKHKQCDVNQICCPNKCYRKRCIEGTIPQEELDEESSEESEQETQTEETLATLTTPETGCPPPSDVSCQEGEACSKHRQCGDSQICCPNKCYRKRCVPGTATSAELAEESGEEQSAEKSEESSQPPVPSRPDTGCPEADSLPCKGAEFCAKHKQCGDEEICCPNKCYRKICVLGTATEADLTDEDSEETSAEQEAEKPVETLRERDTGCPEADILPCKGAEFCSKHKHCGDEEICCPNKCYRKVCTPGTATDEDLADEESEEASVEEKESKEPAQALREKDTGCPESSGVPCTGAEFCSKHKQCGDEEICCPNKCYRKVCTPGTVTKEDLADEESDEASAEQKETTEPVQAVREKDTGCPERDDVPCAGTQCVRNKQCESGQICCSNKCYRRVCVPGTPGSAEEDEESGEASEEATGTSAESKEESVEEPDDCPSPENVPCKDGQKCSDDDDCLDNEICCPNKCYTRKCVAGSRQGEEVEEAPERVRREEPKEETKPVQKPVVSAPKPVTPPVKTPPPVKQAPPTPPALPAPPLVKPASKLSKPAEKPQPKPVIDIPAPEPTIEPAAESVEEESKDQEPLVEELSLDTDIPTELRPREHVEHLLKLDRESSKLESVQNKVYEETLKELKKVYEHAIKPLEVLYKYRDLSNRHFGDAEIFSKPLILFMGPWSGGKSSIINYLLNNEYNETSLRTGAEPSPAYFNLLMYGAEPEIIDGTELAADFTFSGLQKFGQGLEERLRGVKLPVRLLQKVNIVEIPGILEVRKQVSRVFPFNDACQWFIDRADIIFLVYDPAKLDVGPETEAILDQLKGREHQTRIILNKADQIKPEELMRVQGALIWNISPLMSSPQPPVMYTTSLWSKPYEQWAPSRLLQAQERAFLRDLRTAIDRRVENKIASARRFAVRVRNHAKMVDCYLTTYYNHKSVFGNRKQVANEIIEHPQNYHIYEGLSTLTNISRYDLPDPDVYKDFFKLNPLYEFQQLSATCTYFRGCPINRLDIAIAYDLPELIGTYKRNLEEALNAPETPPPKASAKKAPGS